MATPKSVAVPITILTGFLGAGKTTLLNRILNGEHGLRVAVVVNDFGAINIDAELIVGIKDDVISLANGCVCCTVRDDLVETVCSIITRPETPEYILLEASGVADPAGIAMTFLDDRLRDRMRLDCIACVVDADQFSAYPETMELKLRQIAFADMMILNKCDLAGPDRVKAARRWIDGRVQRARVIETSRCDVPLEILLAVGRYEPASTDLSQFRQRLGDGCSNSLHTHGHRDRGPRHGALSDFSTWIFETDQPLCLEALREAARKLPADVYRAKGIIHAQDAPQRRTIFQLVGRRVDISSGGEWRQDRPYTQIVAIGAAGGMNADLLYERVSKCIAAPRTH